MLFPGQLQHHAPLQHSRTILQCYCQGQTDLEPDPDPRIEQGLLKTQHNDVIHAYETTVNYWYYILPRKIFSFANLRWATPTFASTMTNEILLQEGTTSPTPHVFFMGMPANVTGMVPMLLTEDRIPLGLPVQVSKNWH